MKVVVIGIGVANKKYLHSGIDMYSARIKHYTNFEIKMLHDVKKTGDQRDLMKKEAEAFRKALEPGDHVILCDENGASPTSMQLASKLEKFQVNSVKRLVFIIGGAFGFDPDFKSEANELFSLSKLTFSHQMIRLFLVEQIYRAFTIIQNEKYHNE